MNDFDEAEHLACNVMMDANKLGFVRFELEASLAIGSIEIVGAHDWYLENDKFDLKRVIAGSHEKLRYTFAKGYVGVG